MSYGPNQLGDLGLGLDGPSQVALQRALLDAYPMVGELTNLLLELDQKPAAFLVNGNAEDTIQRIVSKARASGWEGNLILAARAMNPGNRMVQAFAALHYPMPIALTSNGGATAALSYAKPADARALEKVVKESLGFLNMDSFLRSYTEISRQVCKVEVRVNGKPTAGTGFLVGPDVVLTNHHVVSDLIAQGGNSTSVTCRFDYFGPGKLAGVPKRLSTTAAFPIAWAPPSACDTMINSPNQPAATELDYALLQLETSVGDEVILVDQTTRGFVSITGAPSPESEPDLFDAESPLVIVQHPDGKPMSLALDTQSILGVNGNGTRLRYRTNTEGGSSGSPCCTMDLRPIALHHVGDPNDTFRYKPQFNQGVPLHAIVAHMKTNFPNAANLLG